MYCISILAHQWPMLKDKRTAQNKLNSKSNFDQKVVVAFERIAQALKVLAWDKGKSLRLNPTQSQLLIYLLDHPQREHTLSSIAKELNISKPSLSDTISTLTQRKLIYKTFREADIGHALVLTAEGEALAHEASDYINPLYRAIGELSEENKETLFTSLGNIIYQLHKQNILPIQRMCLNCNNYMLRDGQSYCRLLDQHLTVEALQIDCPDHQLLP